MPSKSEWIAGETLRGVKLPLGRVNKTREHYALPPLPAPQPSQRLPISVKRPPAKSREQTLAETYACIHRGEQTRTIECKLCGGRVDPVPVYACTLHGECTLRRTKAGKEISCSRCDDRRELVELATSTGSSPDA